jgi:hypothetical protein
MAVENGWGQGAVNNSNDYGKAKANSTNGFGKIYESTNAGLTNIVGGNPVVSISYAFNSFCADASDPTPTVSNNAGAGVFSSTTGLVINSTTGVIDIDASTASTYTVTYTDTDAATAIFDLTIHALPTVTVSVSAGTICVGESTTITASGASSYSWSNGATGNSITVSPTTTTTFTATGTDSNGCVSSGGTTITVNALPTVEISGTLTYCAGSTTTLTATAGLSSYLWSTGATTQAINVTAGSYTVTGTDSNGCSATSSASTVVEYPLPTVSISGTLEFCAGQNTVLTATAGLSSYLWSNGETTQAITVTSGGSYSVTGTDSNGCSNNDSVSVTEHALPTVAISGTLSFCAGANTTLTASGASTYLWSTGETTASITVSSGGSYSVTGTDANGCSALDSASVTEYSLPTVSISGTLTYCAGASTTLDAGSFASYSWSNGETTQTISATAGNYTVTVTDSNGCSNTSAQITVTELALPTVAISGTLSYCAGVGASTTLTATAGLSSYLWSSGETTQSITATAGSYTVTGTDSNGCSTTSSSVTVTETALDNATFSYSASSYAPTDADPTPTISGLTGGTFSGSTGLVINSTTGEIDLSASTVAAHTITYNTTSSGSSVCPNTSTQNVEIAVAGIANNYSMNFDSASSDYIKSSLLNSLDGLSEMSVSLWIKPSGTSQVAIFLSNPNSLTGSGNFQFAIGLLGNDLRFLEGTNSKFFRTTTAPLTYGQWNHIAISYTAPTALIYVNAVAQSTVQNGVPTTLSNADDGLHIGKDRNGFWNVFDGQIDELAIWNTALTDGTGGTVNQIAEIYNATSTNLTKDLTTVSGSNLVYWNRMGDN